MPEIKVRDGEYFESAMKRFKRTVEKSGVMAELRAREFYEKPTTERKRKKAIANNKTYRRAKLDNLLRMQRIVKRRK